MARFILGKSFAEQANGVRRQKIATVHTLAPIQTRHGPAFAYENEFKNRPEPYITVCPGFYGDELPPEDGYRVLDLTPVPQEKRQAVEEDLRKVGYRGQLMW